MSDAGEQRYPPEWGEPRTRTVTWFDPFRARELRRGATGQEFLDGMIDGRFPPPPINGVIGQELVSAGDGEAVFRCTPDESFYNPIGLIHGGLLCTLMDSAMGVAVQTRLPPDHGAASIELKVSFLRPVPADGSVLEVRGKALRVGGRVAFSEAYAYRADGEIVGHATSSLLVQPIR
jgi:uncharacterized protein (TIGR00369 family)